MNPKYSRYPYPFELYALGYERSSGYVCENFVKPVDRDEVLRLVQEASGIPAESFPRTFFGDPVPLDLRFVVCYGWPAQIYVNGTSPITAVAKLPEGIRASELVRREAVVLRSWVKKLIDRNADFIARRTDELLTLHGELTSESVRRLIATA
jgi:hypothetical protein